MRPFHRAGFALALVISAFSTFAGAAGNNIHGTITDPLGAAVSGAQVQLLHAGKLVTTTVTNSEGKYQFAPLPPGRYQIKAEAPTFASRQSDAIYVGNGNAVVNLALKLASVSQEIVVSATGTQVPDTQVGASVSVVTADQFQFKLPALEPLRQVPGLQVLETGQRGVTESVFVRGGNSNANAVWLDGIPVTEIGGAVDFGNIFTTGIDRTEVLRGPNSVLYGADALAGVINLTTTRGKTFRPEISYAFDAGNFNSLHHDVSVG
ncbi:MAG TPA: TonB-dependent receptor plug domain-containing protein, partial [Candidatus Angelobacter sp.]|nr:TonB-dependent receptor plug domain-containing protein [Candidatus Angelobacter sp.]